VFGLQCTYLKRKRVDSYLDLTDPLEVKSDEASEDSLDIELKVKDEVGEEKEEQEPESKKTLNVDELFVRTQTGTTLFASHRNQTMEGDGIKQELLESLNQEWNRK